MGLKQRWHTPSYAIHIVGIRCMAWAVAVFVWTMSGARFDPIGPLMTLLPLVTDIENPRLLMFQFT